MKKKISLLLCLMFALLTFSACGEDPTTVDYYGTGYDTLKEVAESNVSQLSVMSDDELEAVAANMTNELMLKLVRSWQTTTADLGVYQGLGELVVNKANGTVTVDQYVESPDREIVVSYVWEYDYTEEMLLITDINVDLVYTLGEKMTKAGLNTLMGMGTVFAVLILISLIIYCFRIIPYIQGLGKKKTAQEEKEKTPVSSAPALVAAKEVMTDDLELIAVISAAIAAEEGVPADSFVVRSIHRR